MAVAALDHPSHAAMVPQGYGAGVGRVGDINEQGNWYPWRCRTDVVFSLGCTELSMINSSQEFLLEQHKKI